MKIIQFQINLILRIPTIIFRTICLQNRLSFLLISQLYLKLPMIIINNLLHTLRYCTNLYLFVQIIQPRIVYNIVYSKLYFFLLILLVRKYKCFDKFWINLVWDDLCTTDLYPVVLLFGFATIEIQGFFIVFKKEIVVLLGWGVVVLLLGLLWFLILLINLIIKIITFINHNHGIRWSKCLHNR